MFSSFRLARYRLTLEALEPLHLSPFKTSALRGGFGHTFKRLVCFHRPICDKQCQRGNECPYGYIFETAPPAGSQVLSNLNEVPRPFIIESPHDPRTTIRPGGRLVFGLTLVGRGVNYLPYFIVVFRELGQIGLGRTQGQYRLQAIEAELPQPGLISNEKANFQLIYQAEDELVHAIDTTMAWETIAAHAAGLPANQITLEFLTPTRLKHQGKWLMTGPPFQVLIKALLSRVSSLSYFHCGERLEVDFRGLIDRAAEAQTIESKTRWEDWSRFSGRQQQRIDMGGLVGQITYAGDLREYLPLLVLGELVHAGKGTVFGNGQYRILREEAK